MEPLLQLAMTNTTSTPTDLGVLAAASRQAFDAYKDILHPRIKDRAQNVTAKRMSQQNFVMHLYCYLGAEPDASPCRDMQQPVMARWDSTSSSAVLLSRSRITRASSGLLCG